MRESLAKAWEELMKLEQEDGGLAFRRFCRDFQFFEGSAQHVLMDLESDSIDFAYFDPSWFCYTQDTFSILPSWKHAGNSELHLIREVEKRFSDHQAGYLAWFRPILRQLALRLKRSGVVAIHLSSEIAPYFRREMDDIFGRKNFLNELIWCFTSAKGEDNALNSKHDTILIYAKEKGRHYFDREVRRYTNGLEDTAQLDWWDNIPKPSSEAGFFAQGARSELMDGIKNQKPINLLVRLIQTFCSPNGTVADLFLGSGTTAVATYLSNLACEPFLNVFDPSAEGDIVIPDPFYNYKVSTRKFIGGDVEPRALKLTRAKFRKVFDLDLVLRKHQVHKVVFNQKVSRTVPTRVLLASDKDYHAMAEILIGSVLGGLPNPVKSGDHGVDGWHDDGTPVQVKMSDGVGSSQVRNFFGTEEVQDTGKGLFIARSFSDAAVLHCRRMLKRHGREVKLLKLDTTGNYIDLIEVFPRAGQSFLRRSA